MIDYQAPYTLANKNVFLLHQWLIFIPYILIKWQILFTTINVSIVKNYNKFFTMDSLFEKEQKTSFWTSKNNSRISKSRNGIEANVLIIALHLHYWDLLSNTRAQISCMKIMPISLSRCHKIQSKL